MGNVSQAPPRFEGAIYFQNDTSGCRHDTRERINGDSGFLENWCMIWKLELETYLPEGAVSESLNQFYLLYCRPLCRVNVSFVFNFDLLGLR